MKFILIFLLFIFLYIFRRFILNLPRLIYWWIIDKRRNDQNVFPYYGCWFYVGPQGSGKSISVVHQLELLRQQYPKLKIYTNMGYAHETGALTSLRDLLDKSKYNDTDGTVFVLDEIQNEFAASTSQNVPHSILSLVTQQRKNHILILCTSQVFNRVSKPLREQCSRAIECRTIANRYTINRHYDGIEYADAVDKSDNYKHEKRPRLKYDSFVQTDELRDCFDSYKLIERLNRDGFSKK